jgi:hypothetical protein
MLATNAANRWLRFERMLLSAQAGELAKGEADFAELTKRYREFLEAYSAWANFLVDQPLPDSGTPPIIQWLRSDDPHKRRAANDALRSGLDMLSLDGMDILKSGDSARQKTLLEAIRIGLAARSTSP